MGERERLVEALRGEIEKAAEDTATLPRIAEIVDDDAIELAYALDDFEPDVRIRIFDSLNQDQQVIVLEEASERDQEMFVQHLRQSDRLPAILGEMAIDDVVDIVDEVSDEEREELLEGLDEERAEQIRDLAQYEPDTAGGLMTAEFLAVAKETTVGRVKELIRGQEDLESINNIFVIEKERLLGVFSVRQLILADNGDRVEEFMTTDVIHVEVDDDPEEVYRRMETYHLNSLPVVDQFHNLEGIITFDDVLTVGEEEASEDVFRMAGSADLHPTRDTVLGRVKKRFPYLLISLIGGFGTAFVISLFGSGESAVVSEVTYFLPLVVMLCGNIATQSSATMVRGFATGEVDAGRVGRVFVDEVAVGAIVGIGCAVLGALVAYLLDNDGPLRMAFAVFSAVCVLAIIAASLGCGIPSLCNRLKIDPAISAGPFITMLVDAIGCAIYLAFIMWYSAA